MPNTWWWTAGNDIQVDRQWVWAATGRSVDMCTAIPWGSTDPHNRDGEDYLGVKSPNKYADFFSSTKYFVCEVQL